MNGTTVNEDVLCSVFGFVPRLYTAVPLVCARWARVLDRMGGRLVASRRVFPTDALPGNRLSLYRHLGYVRPRGHTDARIPVECADPARGDSVRVSPFGMPCAERMRELRTLCDDFAKRNGALCGAEARINARRPFEPPRVAGMTPAAAPPAEAMGMALELIGQYLLYRTGAWNLGARAEQMVGRLPSEWALLGKDVLLVLPPEGLMVAAAVDLRTKAPYSGGCFESGLYAVPVRPVAWMLCPASPTCVVAYARWHHHETSYTPAYTFDLAAETGLRVATFLGDPAVRREPVAARPWDMPPCDANPDDSDTVLCVHPAE